MTCTAPELSAFLKTLGKNLSFRAKWDSFSFKCVALWDTSWKKREENQKVMVIW